MTPTTTIRASYAIRPRRRIRARHIAAALLMPPAIALSAATSAAIITGARDAMRPIPAPAPCAPGAICFDDPAVDTDGASIRPTLPECNSAMRPGTLCDIDGEGMVMTRNHFPRPIPA